jgi:nucleoside phosphorylase
VILIFCAFGAELAPLRKLLNDATPLAGDHLRGFRGTVGGSAVTIVASGIGVRRAQQSAAIALERFSEVDRIITTGVAGGLHADLAIGHAVLADRLIVRRGEEFAAESVVEVPHIHREIVAKSLGSARITYTTGPLLTSRRAIAKADDKRRAHEALGAIAVDMESAVIALEAERRGIPFVCLRTIMDTATESIDGARLADENGRVKPLAAAAALISQPSLVLASMRLTRNLRAATRSMAQAVGAALNADA